MRLKVVFFLMVAVLGMKSGRAQFNEYKYIIVPKQFDGYKEPNKHQTSTLVKYHLTQHGFNVVYDDALPDDLLINRCLGLLADIDDTSNMLTTKLSILFKDCRSNEVFRTVEGTSRAKEFKEAYKEALQKAFVSFEGIYYSYEPKDSTEDTNTDDTITISFKDDIKTLDDTPSGVIEQVATPENQIYKNLEPTPSEYVKGQKAQQDLLYAQPTEYGFQIVDSTSEIRLKLIRSSLENIYLVDGDIGNGIVFEKNGSWWLEWVENGKKAVEELKLKF